MLNEEMKQEILGMALGGFRIQNTENSLENTGKLTLNNKSGSGKILVKKSSGKSITGGIINNQSNHGNTIKISKDQIFVK